MKLLKQIGIILKKTFIDGIFFLLPFGIMVLSIKLIISFLSQALLPLRYFLPQHLAAIPYIEIVVGIALAIIAGALIKVLILKTIIYGIEEYIVKKIPLINTIYFAIKRIGNTMSPNKPVTENQRVAWVRVPAKNMYCLGLMTSMVKDTLAPEQGRKYCCFFIPHTPNPITGYYVVVAEDECVFVEITRQEALSIIMSAGVVQPEQK